jgi:hypothetical protein
MMLDEGELDFARSVRFADSPVAAVHFRSTILDRREKHNTSEYDESQSATHSHN